MVIYIYIQLYTFKDIIYSYILFHNEKIKLNNSNINGRMKKSIILKKILEIYSINVIIKQFRWYGMKTVLGGSMLELKNISFDIEDDLGKGKEIIKDISLEIDDHKLVAVTGPNGGGKSTLAKIIAGIYKPNSGKIFFDGKDITEMGITERAKAGISFAFQQPVRFKGIKVHDLIQLAVGEKISVTDSCRYLSEVGLCARDYVNREVDASLSGGEIKRIEIATLLARNTKLSVLDEPEAGIDLWSFSNLISVFERMREDRERSILIISHQERILDIADEIIVIEDGRVKARGSRDDILPGLLNEAPACKCIN